MSIQHDIRVMHRQLRIYLQLLDRFYERLADELPLEMSYNSAPCSPRSVIDLPDSSDEEEPEPQRYATVRMPLYEN
jgi:hypothetical protein